MKRYYKIIDDQMVWFHQPLIADGKQIFNATEEMIFDAGWIEYIEPAPTLEQVKADKINEIKTYDQSNAVNEFYIGDISAWLDKETRAGLMLRFSAESAMGKTNTTLWLDTTPINMSIQEGTQMLYVLEDYASKCFDKTAEHQANVKALETIADVEAYDYTVGYPQKIHF